MEATLAQLATLAGASLRGDGQVRVCGVAGIQHARPGEISLLASRRFARFLTKTGATALVVGPDIDPAATELPLLVAQRPEEAFEAIAAHFAPPVPRPQPGTHPTAAVDPAARIEPSATVGASCVVEAGAAIGPRSVLRPCVFVGRDARIGSDCVLHPHVAVLDRCVLGDRVVLHSGTVIGADGFGYTQVDGVHQKVPQHGVVEVGDDVEVGANTTIDRARYGRTVIGRGTKIDNLVQVAHNVVVGDHCILVAQSGLAGSTALGRHVVVAAQGGLRDHLDIGDGAIITAQSGVSRDVGPGEIMMGSPAQEARRERRAIVHHHRLPELAGQLRALARAVEALTERVRQLEAESADDPPSR